MRVIVNTSVLELPELLRQLQAEEIVLNIAPPSAGVSCS